ncbi:hypothetical protein KEM48_008126 [Puccinia striiformis f. sp. tritici PST-130]|nr:hypothetical protein KEM48_008126 [Puccinia striiformis f. sp. tritici PST-130]
MFYSLRWLDYLLVPELVLPLVAHLVICCAEWRVVPVLTRIGALPDTDLMIVYRESSSSMVPTRSLDRVLCGALFVGPLLAYLVLKLLLPTDRLIPLRLGLLGATFGSGLLGVAIAGLGLNTLIYWVSIKPRIDSWIAVRQQASSSENAGGTERPLLHKLDRLAPACATPPAWQLPEMTNNEITARLVLGSALFGLGWGLAGVCPGPALVVFGAYPLSMVMWEKNAELNHPMKLG